MEKKKKLKINLISDSGYGCIKHDSIKIHEFSINNFIFRSNFFFFAQVIVVVFLTGAYSQPRIAVPPGAIPIPLRPLPYRNERLVNGAGVNGGPNVGLVRFRRPVLAARQQQLPPNNLLDEAKPVTEEPESGETPSYFVPHTHPQPQPQPQAQPNLPTTLYRIDENGEISDTNRALDSFSPTRFGGSPSPPEERIVPTTIRTTAGAQRFGSQPKPAVSEIVFQLKIHIANDFTEDFYFFSFALDQNTGNHDHIHNSSRIQFSRRVDHNRKLFRIHEHKTISTRWILLWICCLHPSNSRSFFFLHIVGTREETGRPNSSQISRRKWRRHYHLGIRKWRWLI